MYKRTRLSLIQDFVWPGFVVSRGVGGAMALPDFGRSVNSISTKGDRLCPPNNTGTSGFLDLPTALIGC